MRAKSEELQSTVPTNHKTPLCRGPAGVVSGSGGFRRPSAEGHKIVQNSLLGPATVLKRDTMVGTKARREQVAFIYRRRTQMITDC